MNAATQQPPTFDEIARSLDISTTAAKRAYARALAKLARQIALQAELLEYPDIESYLQSGDDRIARIEPDPDNPALSIIRFYRPKSES